MPKKNPIETPKTLNFLSPEPLSPSTAQVLHRQRLLSEVDRRSGSCLRMFYRRRNFRRSTNDVSGDSQEASSLRTVAKGMKYSATYLLQKVSNGRSLTDPPMHVLFEGLPPTAQVWSAKPPLYLQLFVCWSIINSPSCLIRDLAVYFFKGLN